MRSPGRLVRASLAAALGLVVLSGTSGTTASWVERVQRHPGTISSGEVVLRNTTHRVELHSRQPAQSRTYASATTCAPDPDYTECRVITETIGSEALISGDRVVVVDEAELSATGTNLTGTLEVRASALTSQALSAFSGSATTTTTIVPPSGTAVTGSTASFPVAVASGQGIGTYTVRSVITTPPSKGGASWGTSLTGQRLYEGTVDYTFRQA